MTSAKTNLLDLSYEALAQLLEGWGEPRFRTPQLWRWVYNALISDPDEMLNLPKDLRARLKEETRISYLKPRNVMVDGIGLTEKVLFEAEDAQTFESVLMRYDERNTICVSSQIGCAIRCVFCATGQKGFVRNLTTGEIIAQVLHYLRRLRALHVRVANIVFMGMGEPFLNYDAVWQTIVNLNHRGGVALGARRFTVSTAGVIPGIERLAQEALPVGLAISLHAPDDDLRSQLVPLDRRYPLDRLLAAIRRYIERTGRRVTFEYALAQGVNDTDAHARQTAALLRGMLCHVNLIPLNPSPGCPYAPSSRERMARFQEILTEARIQTTTRLRRGVDVQAGCGQLRARQRDELDHGVNEVYG